MALTKVSTDGVKDDAITKTKIPANQIEASELADNAVDTNAIADQAVSLSKLPHGTSSNDGKFLRANNGADPTFETVTGTTINNNADNRVITGSGAANTLNAESSVVIDSSGRVGIGATSFNDAAEYLLVKNDSTAANLSIVASNDAHSSLNLGDEDDFNIQKIKSDHTNNSLQLFTNNAERMRIDSSGNVGIGTTSPDVGNSAYKVVQVHSSSTNAYFKLSNDTTGSGSGDGVELSLSGSDAFLTNRESANLIFRTAATERMRILHNGGITFNGDTAAANALDAYEEGSFTPVYAMSGGGQNVTYHDQQGQYVKIGKFVHCSIHLRINTVHANGSGIAYIGGLPFQGASNTGQGPGYGTAAVGYIGGQGGGSWWHGYVEQGQVACYLYKSASGGTSQNVTIANDLYNAGSLRISLSYQVT